MGFAMPELNSSDYYRRRAQQSRDYAVSAHSPEVRAIHLDLASRYADLLQKAERLEYRPLLSIVTRER